MDSLLDSMFLKRFCLPSNINIKDDEYTINKCLCGTSNHIACIFKVKTSSNINKTRILNFGINSWIGHTSRLKLNLFSVRTKSKWN